MSCASRSSLEAFVAGRLSVADARSFEAHLPGCPECRTETARVRALRTVLSSYQPYEPAELDWQRLDRKVLSAMDAALSQPQESLLSRLFPAFSLAAATAAVLVLTFAVRTAELAAPVAAHLDHGAALAVATESDCQVMGQSGELRDLASPVLSEGDVIKVGQGTLTVQTAAATGVRLGALAQVELAELTAAATSMRLISGELSAEVKPLAPGNRFQVRAGDLLVSVRGTAFRVIRGPRSTRVEVLHGLVSVERQGGSAVLVPGPGSIEIEDGAPFHAEAVSRSIEAATESAFPLGLADRAMAELVGEAPAVVARVEPKSVVEPEPPSKLMSVVCLVGTPGWKQSHPDSRIGDLKRNLEVCLTRDHGSDLLDCYEKAMPNGRGELTLEVAIDGRGNMQSIESKQPSGIFLSCARQIIRRCEQPGVGEDVKIEIPLALKHR